MKKCTREFHEVLKLDNFSWNSLELVGTQETGLDEYDLELRNCKCGSTLARRIPKRPA